MGESKLGGFISTPTTFETVSSSSRNRWGRDPIYPEQPVTATTDTNLTSLFGIVACQEVILYLPVQPERVRSIHDLARRRIVLTEPSGI